jgi:hypothetical protein
MPGRQREQPAPAVPGCVGGPSGLGDLENFGPARTGLKSGFAVRSGPNEYHAMSILPWVGSELLARSI